VFVRAFLTVNDSISMISLRITLGILLLAPLMARVMARADPAPARPASGWRGDGTGVYPTDRPDPSCTKTIQTARLRYGNLFCVLMNNGVSRMNSILAAASFCRHWSSAIFLGPLLFFGRVACHALARRPHATSSAARQRCSSVRGAEPARKFARGYSSRGYSLQCVAMRAIGELIRPCG
jgi:hypothetical protein